MRHNLNDFIVEGKPELRISAIVQKSCIGTIVLASLAVAAFGQQTEGRNGRRAWTRAADTPDTSTDFLSDDDWRRMPREERRRQSAARMAARFTEGETTSVQKLSAYVEKYREMNVYDARLYLLKASAEHVPGTENEIILNGEASVPQFRNGIETTLKSLGFAIKENRIAVLPDPSLAPETYALSTTYAATMRKEPRDRSEQVNSVPIGGAVRLLRAARSSDLTTGTLDSADWILAQTTEGYTGFMKLPELKRKARVHLPDAMLVRETTVTVDGRQLVLPSGALLHGEPGKYAIEPDGIPIKSSAELETVSVGKPLFTKEQIIDLMKPLIGKTTYVWGGVTEAGLDCSGFTQYLWKTRGVFLPRDAEEQAIVGQIVAWGRDVAKEAQPGDLIFFGGRLGKISHVGISLGNGEVIHSSGGKGVNVTTLEGKDDDDDSGNTLIERTVFARRMQSK